MARTKRQYVYLKKKYRNEMGDNLNRTKTAVDKCGFLKKGLILEPAITIANINV